MALDTLLNPEFLLPLDVAIYVSALAGVIRARQVAFRPRDPALAFSLLEKSLRKVFPDIPQGFTWREALRRLENLNLDVEWGEVTKALKQYEGWRYGEMVKPEEVNAEVVRIAKELSRRGRRWFKG